MGLRARPGLDHLSPPASETRKCPRLAHTSPSSGDLGDFLRAIGAEQAFLTTLTFCCLQMSPRAPFLTAPDYVFYLRRQVDKERAEFVDNEDAKENSFNGSMDMPKLSDLLHKLSEDLRGASAGQVKTIFPHFAFVTNKPHYRFVDDFVSEPNSGLTWLLDILRLSLNRQQCPGMVVSDAKESASNKGKLLKTRDRQHLLKRAMVNALRRRDACLSLRLSTLVWCLRRVQLTCHPGVRALALRNKWPLWRSLEALWKRCSLDSECIRRRQTGSVNKQQNKKCPRRCAARVGLGEISDPVRAYRYANESANRSAPACTYLNFGLKINSLLLTTG